MNRPIGITIISILQFLSGGIAILAGLGFLLFKDQMLQAIQEGAATSGEAIPPEMETLFSIGGGALLLFGLLGLLLGWGLFTLKKWAWFVYLVVQGLSVFSGLGNLIVGITQAQAGDPTGLVGAIIGLIITGLLIYYFLRIKVRQAFRVSA